MTPLSQQQLITYAYEDRMICYLYYTSSGLFASLSRSCILVIYLLALLAFDYCLTLGREIKCIWPLRLSTSSIIFYTGRYSALLTAILLCFGEYWTRDSQEVCVAFFSALMCHLLDEVSAEVRA
ncbi:hypothetical protein C8Q76DRAFT_724971 [Earliella scabrosa]|nr:hypothetical protein C8Q76DRAFT_724971 [Earliella scabrosa]